MAKVFDLSKDEILELIGQLTDIASAEEPSRPARAVDRTTARDPFVRSLAAVAIHDLKENKHMSYRDIARMFHVSHSRVHQLHSDLAGKRPKRISVR